MSIGTINFKRPEPEPEPRKAPERPKAVAKPAPALVRCNNTSAFFYDAMPFLGVYSTLSGRR